MENTYNIQMRIKEIQNEKKRTDKLYKLSLIMFIPIIPLFFIGAFLEEPFLLKIACALFVIDPVFLICICFRIGKQDEELASLFVKNEGIESVLNRYCQVERFDPNDSLDNGDRKLLKSFGFFAAPVGRNYLKGMMNDIPIETSYIRLHVDDLDNSAGSYYEFNGQIAYLRNSKSFPGKLLITRDNTPGSGFDFKDFAYEAVIKRILGTSKSDRKLPDIRNPINISREFDTQWRVFTSNPDAAMLMLYKNTDLYKRLLEARNLSFVLYREDEILLGGQYSFDLLKGTSEERRASCEQAMDGLFNEAIAAALSAEYPAVK